jgi:hypothetical protein
MAGDRARIAQIGLHQLAGEIRQIGAGEEARTMPRTRGPALPMRARRRCPESRRRR